MLVSNGYTGTGPRVDLATIDLAGVVLAPGDHHAFSLAVAPPSAGDAQLELELDFSDAQQAYASRGDFIVTIAP